MLQRIEDLLYCDKLIASDWEVKFLNSIAEQANNKGSLSIGQLNILERIENNNTSEAHKQIKKWLDNWDEERQEIAKVVALYYQREMYYGQLVDKILNQNYIPSQKEYEKLCENKYALKVRQEHFKKPRFSEGSVVQVRSVISANSHYRHENGNVSVRIQNHYAIVIETDALPVRRAAKGAKVYKILPFGSSKAYYVSESDLKKAKGVKNEVLLKEG